jgi:lysophospholipid acyltransferase (LPLAT)-like uncharacterized protein
MAQRRNESRRQRRLRAVLAPVVAWALRALGASWRVEFRGDDPFVPPEGESERRPFLAALWHEDVIAAATVFRDTGVQVPVSLSRDGSHITAVMRRLGLGDPPRGSSSRSGSAALRGVVRAVRETGLVAMLVDGPRGPARQPKPGIVAAARLSGEPILPVALEARPCLRFGSWDRTKLPLPFARVVVGYGERLSVGRDVSGSDQEVLLDELQQRLVQLGEAGRARLEGGASRPEPPPRHSP